MPVLLSHARRKQRHLHWVIGQEAAQALQAHVVSLAAAQSLAAVPAEESADAAAVCDLGLLGPHASYHLFYQLVPKAGAWAWAGAGAGVWAEAEAKAEAQAGAEAGG